MRWKNWYRMRDISIDNRRVTCTICGVTETKDAGEVFPNHHCGQDGEGFVSEAEAKEYAPRIYMNNCEWLGAYPVGKKPPPNAKALERVREP